MKIYKITEASKYLGISINSLKTLANNGKLNSFKTGGEHRRFSEVHTKLNEIAIERARITQEWDYYQGLRVELQLV